MKIEKINQQIQELGEEIKILDRDLSKQDQKILIKILKIHASHIHIGKPDLGIKIINIINGEIKSDS